MPTIDNLMQRVLFRSFAFVAFAATLHAQTPDTTHYTILGPKEPSGVVNAWFERDGTRGFHMEYNDRGRGPSLTQHMRLGPDGYPRVVDIEGNDYYKAAVSEHFIIEQTGGTSRARWKSSAESATVALKSPAIYLPMNDASVGILESLLLASPGHRVRLLPQGEARSERIRDITIADGASTKKVTLYAMHGLWFTPYTWWADERGAFFAAGGSWFMTIRRGFESARPALLAAQAKYDSARGVDLAKKMIHVPARSTVFTNANLFDAESGTVRAHTTVVVTGDRIAAVGASGSVAVPRDAKVIDVGGKTLLPGLWDMHVHASDDDGLQNLAAGVTTIRDLGGGDPTETLRLKERVDSGTHIGPRMLLAGLMDGPGPYAGPTQILVSTPDSARAWVNWLADRGYQQVKMYSSLDTALVRVVTAEAHKRGLRTSGHVPNGMTAEEFVRAGVDEIQHVNFLFLNFWRDSVKDTRTPERFTAPAQRAALLDLQSERVQSFVRLLRERQIVLDPTLVAFEGMFVGRPGKFDPGAAEFVDRLPPSIRRSLLGGGLPVPDSLDQRYRDSFAAFLKMIKTMYDGGVPIVAGTDGFSGFSLHRELELYAAAGIPASEVLRIATINAAKVMHRDTDLGSIAPGKLADLIIVDGHPEQRMSDIRRVVYVMKGGKVYDPAALYSSVGVRPAAPSFPGTSTR